jgi:hypothetical protein
MQAFNGLPERPLFQFKPVAIVYGRVYWLVETLEEPSNTATS